MNRLACLGATLISTDSVEEFQCEDESTPDINFPNEDSSFGASEPESAAHRE